MPAIQTSYAETMPKGAVGRQVNMEEWNAVSRSNESATAIGFGVPVTRGAGEFGCLPIGAGTFTAVGAAGTPAPAAATITAEPTAVYPVQVGVYRVTAIVGGAGTASKWEVTAPDGSVVGIATGNTAFSGGGLGFTITDAGTDPVAGESFDITVSETGDPDFLGVSIADASMADENFPRYATLGIMTMGTIWVLAGGTVTQGAPALFDLSDQKWKAGVPGGDNILIPGAEFDSGGGNGDLVKLRITRPAGAGAV
jgi:hypothetical protein